MLYGTSEQPYSMRREQARSAELPTDGDDLTEEYNGESLYPLSQSSFGTRRHTIITPFYSLDTGI